MSPTPASLSPGQRRCWAATAKAKGVECLQYLVPMPVQPAGTTSRLIPPIGELGSQQGRNFLHKGRPRQAAAATGLIPDNQQSGPAITLLDCTVSRRHSNLQATPTGNMRSSGRCARG